MSHIVDAHVAYIKAIADLSRDKVELLDRIKRLEEQSESRWLLAQSAVESCAEMSSRIQRLEEAGDKAILNSYLPDRIAMWNKAKEDKL